MAAEPGAATAGPAARGGPRRGGVQRSAEVTRIQWVTPRMVRITVGGAGLDGFTSGAFTDHYVKLQFPPAGAPYSTPFDPAAVKEQFPREVWPVTRTYTVRHWDPIRRELTIDFVVHGESGTAGPWAARAEPGDLLQLQGPGGAYAPRSDAECHLMIGDASALPAIAVALERLSRSAVAHVVVEVEGPEERQALSSAAELHQVWVEADGMGAALEDAVRGLDFPDGTTDVFLHGEAGSVRRVRRHLVVDRGLDVSGMSVSGYWKQRRTEDGWRAEKADWNRAVEADVADGRSGA
jgi:NADPH-dependent ferric siderophore reductase